MAEKKTKGLGLPETKGQFELRGIVTGVQKDSFYTEKTAKNDKPFRMVNFGVQVDKETTLYVTLTGMEQENVYFSKSEKGEDGKRKTEVEPVSWKDRFLWEREGFRLIGVGCGVKKTLDKSGKEVNDKHTLTSYDACLEISENLADGQSVYVRGNIVYSTYNDRRQMKFEPAQVSLCREVDFDAEDFKPLANFTQTFVFMGIQPAEERYTVAAKIVGYSTVEDAEFVIEKDALAGQFKKKLKPYQSIKAWGRIQVAQDVELVEAAEDDGCWGEENDMEKIGSPVVKELIITGANPETIEKEVYAEENLDAAIAKMKAVKQVKEDYGEKWGSVGGEALDDETGW